MRGCRRLFDVRPRSRAGPSSRRPPEHRSTVRHREVAVVAPRGNPRSRSSPWATSTVMPPAAACRAAVSNRLVLPSPAAPSIATIAPVRARARAPSSAASSVSRSNSAAAPAVPRESAIARISLWRVTLPDHVPPSRTLGSNRGQAALSDAPRPRRRTAPTGRLAGRVAGLPPSMVEEPRMQGQGRWVRAASLLLYTAGVPALFSSPAQDRAARGKASAPSKTTSTPSPG